MSNDNFTIADVYHKLGTLEGLVTGIHSELKASRQDQDAQELRIRSLETSHATAKGVTGVVSAVVAVIVTFITTKFAGA